MNKRRKKNNKLKYYLLFLLSFTIIFSSLAKYRTALATNTGARVAKAVLNLNTDDDYILVTMDPVNPKNTQDFYFDVTNKNDSKISEVTMEYTIELERFNNLPLDLKLYKSSDGENYSEEVELNDLKTSSITIGKDTEENHMYKLVFSWQEDSKNYQYSKTIDYIKIKVNGEQVD